MSAEEPTSEPRHDGREEGAEALDLSIVIVCYNDREVLLPCLESIYASEPKIAYEAIVTDNASADGSGDEVRRLFPQTVVVDAGYNAGYTGGNNIGYRHYRGRYVLYLNPDTIILDDALDVLVRRADELAAEGDHALGAIAPNVRNADGTNQRSVYRSPRLVNFIDSFLLNRLPLYSKLFGFYGYRDADYEREMEVDIVAGCGFIAPREVIDEVGGFDEGYFIYYEEADLQERIRASGRPIVYYPEARIIHLGGQTTVKQQTWFRIECERSRRRFFKLHRSRLSQLLLGPVLFLDSIARCLFGLVALALTLGRSAHVRSKTGIEVSVLLWQLGLRAHTEKPPPPPGVAPAVN